MKFISMRSAAALALALTLAACGGDKAKFTIGGHVEGLAYPGLVLTTGKQDITVSPPAKAGDDVNFSFPDQIEYGEVYDVSVKNDPLHQTCQMHPQARTNTAGLVAEIHAIVYCSINQFTVGGTISGLTADGLVLANGSSLADGRSALPASVAKDATSFTMPDRVPYGVTYGITVLTQPAGLTCTVANPSGTMGDAKVENITITCVPNT